MVQKKLRKQQGFTLAEVLATVAILLLLSAAVIPGVVSAFRNLKAMERDDTAREIYLAAQNALTTRKAAGTLREEGTKDPTAQHCYWLSEDLADPYLLSIGSIETVAAGNHYLIWYNADSATVLEVYYSEHPLPKDAIMDGQFSDTADPALRRAEGIGYYNGADLARQPVEQLLPPQLTVTNGERLEISVQLRQFLAYYQKGVTLTVTVEELDDGGSPVPGHIREFFGSQSRYDLTDGSWQVTLDALLPNPGEQRIAFRDTCPAITPGANVRITAVLSAPDSDGTRYLPAQTSADTNSLFASRTTVDGRDTLSIASARHLQNLNPAFAYASGALPPSDGRLYVRQTADILWPQAAAFQSISTDRIAEFQGNQLHITGLLGENGLFADARDIRLDGIRLLDPQIVSTRPAANVGALAGQLHGSTVVSDCRVYLRPTAGGTYPDHGITAPQAAAAGGLIGSAEAAQIQYCFSALSHIHAGGSVGGLVGTLGGSAAVQNCYASVEDLSGTPARAGMLAGHTGTAQLSRCYAVGNMALTDPAALTGGLAGSSQGQGIRDCYCAVTYLLPDGSSAAQPDYGLAAAGDSGCRYLRGTTAPTETEQALPLSYRHLAQSGGTLPVSMTHPYRAQLHGLAYPFPALDDGNGQFMPHYGSWPEQRVDDICIYDSAQSGEPIPWVALPQNGTVTFWAEARSGGAAAMVETQVDPDPASTVLQSISNDGYDPLSGRTRITLHSGVSTGAIPVSLTAEEVEMRAVAVVYDAQVTISDAANHSVLSSTDSSGAKTVGQMTLNTGNRTGMLSAALSVTPTRAEVQSAVRAMEPGAADNYTLSASPADFVRWDKLRTGDPAVTANGDPENGAYILEPVNGNYYPHADAAGILTVTGAASGTADVSARWAAVETLEAKCHIKMEGARALIASVSAVGDLSGPLGEKSNYPYRLNLTAQPGEPLRLTFTPKLFNTPLSAPGGTYTWTLTRDGVELLTGVSSPTVNGGQWTCPVTDSMAQATYRVTLVYTNTAGERSADYTTFTVYRAAKRQPAPYASIQIAQSAGGGFHAGAQASVEQVNGNGYDAATDLTLQGWVDGAANSKVKWSYSTDGTNWTAVTGHLGSLPVPDDTGRIRATVQWLNTTTEHLGHQTGGAVLVRGLDANEYDAPFSFHLLAEAAESTGDTGQAAKQITVTVMPKLKLTPKVQTFRYYYLLSPNAPQSQVFAANRSDLLFADRNGNSYHWSWTTADGTPDTADTRQPEQQVPGIPGQSNVELLYGPHRATAVLNNLNVHEGFSTSINRTEELDGKQYFLVEKDRTEELEFSWGAGFLSAYRISSHPSAAAADIQPLGGSGSAYERVGAHRYAVTGRYFTHQTVLPLQWVLDRQWSSSDPTVTHYLAVVGMEITDDAGVSVSNGTVTMNAPGDRVRLLADNSFPAELMAPNTQPEITWSLSAQDAELVSLAGSTQAPDGSLHCSGADATLVARKYTPADYTATLTARCVFTGISGERYIYTDHVAVSVPPSGAMSVTVEPCTDSDLAALRSLFPQDGLHTGSLLAAVNELGQSTLILEPAFGCDTLYLKLRAQSGGSALALADYFQNLYIDRSYAEMTTRPSADGTTLYIRLHAAAANAIPTVLPLEATVGTAPKVVFPIALYQRPGVQLTDAAGQDVTDGSTPVYQNDIPDSQLTARLVPQVSRAGDPTHTPLDQVLWEMQAPTGYRAEEYLTLTQSGSTATVKLIRQDRMPDFRVVLHARSARDAAADAGYALVFLPENRQP